MKIKFISALALLALGACATEQTVATPDDRAAVYYTFSDLTECKTHLLRSGYESDHMDEDCRCVQNVFAADMPDWMAIVIAKHARGEPVAEPPNFQQRVKAAFVDIGKSVNKKCGLPY